VKFKKYKNLKCEKCGDPKIGHYTNGMPKEFYCLPDGNFIFIFLCEECSFRYYDSNRMKIAND